MSGPTSSLGINSQQSGEKGKPGQTVSFGDLDNQERTKRFTISAHPSTVNVPAQENVSPILRKSSTTGKSLSELLKLSGPSGGTIPKLKQSENINPESGSNSEKSSLLSSPTTSPFLKHCATNIGDKASTLDSPSPPPSEVQVTQPIKINSPAPSRRNSQKKSNKAVVASPIGPPLPLQEYLSREDDGKFHILLGCTGSVATVKVPLIIDKLFQIFDASKISIQLVITKSASHFLKGLKINKDVKIWRDEDEWANFSRVVKQNFPNPVNPNNISFVKKPKSAYDNLILHNELRKWADIMLVAPLSANTLAKIANGLLDNLLTSIIRSWGQASNLTVKKPILVAPAMNTLMYTHPITAKQLAILASQEDGFGMEVLKPVEKVLVCGDIGMGGMREWSEIVDILRRKIIHLRTERKRDENCDDNSKDSIAEEEEDEDEEEEEEDRDGIEDGFDEDDEDDEDDDDEDDDVEGEDSIESPEEVSEVTKMSSSDKNGNQNDLIFDITDETNDDSTVS